MVVARSEGWGGFLFSDKDKFGAAAEALALALAHMGTPPTAKAAAAAIFRGSQSRGPKRQEPPHSVRDARARRRTRQSVTS